MNDELVFSLVGLLSMAGWATLIASPLIPRWSDRIAGTVVPVLLAIIYLAIALTAPSQEGGGFATFAEVTLLFSSPGALLAGWVHFLAFDLLVGAWACRTGRREGMGFGWVLPCLPVIFLFGPGGFLIFSVARRVHRLVYSSAAAARRGIPGSHTGPYKEP